MKPLYWVLIIVAVLIVGFLIYNANQKRKAAEAAALAAQLSQTTSSQNPNGTSNVAQILNSLFPFFNAYTTSKTGA